MPFKSKAQQRQCYALKAQGKAGTWDCDEWADETKDFKKLPEKVKKVKKVKKESKMEATEKFVNFLNDIKTPDTKLMVESIQKAFAVCFESYYAGGDDYTGETGEDGSGDIPTGNTASNGGTGASAMNEDADSDADKLKNIEKQKAVLAKEEELTNEQIELDKVKDITDIDAAKIKEEEGKNEIADVDIN